jgi:predicted short-subunit dehydrogenase-like oxidoreductase (DUF2520 family)
MKVFFFGAGKVGRALARGLKHAGGKATLHPARDGIPTRKIRADVLVVGVRDRDIQPVSEKLAPLVSKATVCVHVAGALGPEPLAPLRAVSGGVAQMHPMISFASPRFVPTLAGGHVHVQGDAKAVAMAKRLARLIGMVPRTFENLDTVAYHASAGLLANGAAALAAAAAELLVRAGVPRETAPRMLGPLLQSVAENVQSLGFPECLTGPVRRGEVKGLEKHVAVLGEKLPEAVPLYLASAHAQLTLARAIGDAPGADFDAIARFLASRST